MLITSSVVNVYSLTIVEDNNILLAQESNSQAENSLVIRYLTNPDMERRYDGIILAQALDVPGEIIEPYLTSITTNISLWTDPIF